MAKVHKCTITVAKMNCNQSITKPSLVQFPTSSEPSDGAEQRSQQLSPKESSSESEYSAKSEEEQAEQEIIHKLPAKKPKEKDVSKMSQGPSQKGISRRKAETSGLNSTYPPSLFAEFEEY